MNLALFTCLATSLWCFAHVPVTLLGNIFPFSLIYFEIIFCSLFFISVNLLLENSTKLVIFINDDLYFLLFILIFEERLLIRFIIFSSSFKNIFFYFHQLF